MPVPTITLTFADGSVLHASDLNHLVTAINQVINQSNTNATNIATKASASDIANVTDTANQAILTANTANNAAYTAQTSAADAVGYALNASSVADQALEETQLRTKMLEVLETADIANVEQRSYLSIDGVVFNTRTGKFVAKHGATYINNWLGAAGYGEIFSANGWTPREKTLYYMEGTGVVSLMFYVNGTMYISKFNDILMP